MLRTLREAAMDLILLALAVCLLVVCLYRYAHTWTTPPSQAQAENKYLADDLALAENVVEELATLSDKQAEQIEALADVNYELRRQVQVLSRALLEVDAKWRSALSRLN